MRRLCQREGNSDARQTLLLRFKRERAKYTKMMQEAKRNVFRAYLDRIDLALTHRLTETHSNVSNTFEPLRLGTDPTLVRSDLRDIVEHVLRYYLTIGDNTLASLWSCSG